MEAQTVGKKPEIFNILIIEDSQTIRRYNRYVFEQAFENCDVRESSDGREGFRELSQKKADLIVIDLKMPGMDGPTFVDKLRSNQILKNKPVLVITGMTDEIPKLNFKNDPLVRILSKPAKQGDIIRAVKDLIPALVPSEN